MIDYHVLCVHTQKNIQEASKKHKTNQNVPRRAQGMHGIILIEVRD